MLASFLDRKNRCETSVRSLEDLAPFLAGFGLDQLAEALLLLAPARAVHLVAWVFGRQSQLRDQLRVEFGFDRTD